MSDKNTGGYAFPSEKIVKHPGQFTPERIPTDGMTLRDYFAAKALQGALAHDARVSNEGAVARGCYLMADAMLEARNG